jgi:hypothetical protein
MHAVHAAETHAARRTTEGLDTRAHRSVFVHARAEIDWVVPHVSEMVEHGGKLARAKEWLTGMAHTSAPQQGWAECAF